MKKQGHLNRDISRVLAGMGHTDCIVIADCGLPIPPGVECIDLAVRLGEPGFATVLASLLDDFIAERAVFASEALTANSDVATQASALARIGITIDYVPHAQFKQLSREAKAIIRTGEASPYANVLLYSGVAF
ncbi:ribose transport protein RbsD [Andreprevotia lacus DSM 23236]|jgi:D-ribose pyranase|uniref:D-ribose pyranase n=1 Tax=Andreprevotia lacus DSM 23236 TaxID=1121001 RepID=A0A1W1XWU0_9NEIS|nr:D-ribose pyranase [Andreprevotia lacus]SMC28396.1 ribose transport protein RbsD [Andreprevotia lacus DSM 23236]